MIERRTVELDRAPVPLHYGGSRSESEPVKCCRLEKRWARVRKNGVPGGRPRRTNGPSFEKIRPEAAGRRAAPTRRRPGEERGSKPAQPRHRRIVQGRAAGTFAKALSSRPGIPSGRAAALPRPLGRKASSGARAANSARKSARDFLRPSCPHRGPSSWPRPLLLSARRPSFFTRFETGLRAASAPSRRRSRCRG